MKGQAAIEYLVTYGWAILVLVIVAGLIYTSGIFSPSYLISDQCDLGPKFPCTHYISKENNNVQLSLTITNGFEHAIRIQSIAIQENNQPNTQLTLQTPISDLNLIDSGDSRIIRASRSDTAPRQSTKTFRVRLQYYSCAPEVTEDCARQSGPARDVSGKITGKIN